MDFFTFVTIVIIVSRSSELFLYVHACIFQEEQNSLRPKNVCVLCVYVQLCVYPKGLNGSLHEEWVQLFHNHLKSRIF